MDGAITLAHGRALDARLYWLGADSGRFLLLLKDGARSDDELAALEDDFLDLTLNGMAPY